MKIDFYLRLLQLSHNICVNLGSYSQFNYTTITDFLSENFESILYKDLNYTKHDNIPIRLILATPENINTICSHKGCLIISNLEENIETSHLHDAFSNFGEVIYARIPLKKVEGSMVSQRYSYVQFKN